MNSTLPLLWLIFSVPLSIVFYFVGYCALYYDKSWGKFLFRGEKDSGARLYLVAIIIATLGTDSAAAILSNVTYSLNVTIASVLMIIPIGFMYLIAFCLGAVIKEKKIKKEQLRLKELEKQAHRKPSKKKKKHHK